MDGTYQSTRQIRRRLQPILKGKWAKSRAKYAGFSDEKYYVATRAELQRLVTESDLWNLEFSPGVMDCDDFTFALKGLLALRGRELGVESSICLGIAWGRFSWSPEPHAANWAIDASGDVWWIEPQTDTFYPASACLRGLSLLVA